LVLRLVQPAGLVSARAFRHQYAALETAMLRAVILW
jgi:hypothetical protein